MKSSPEEPSSLGQTEEATRWPALLVVGLLASIGLTVILIVAGTWDPGPTGNLVASVAPGTRTTSSTGVVEWLADQSLSPVPPLTATLQLEAAFTRGEPDSGYGLVYGNANSALVVAASPLGYAAVWEQGASGEPDLFHVPWQPWPHVRAATTPNEIWLDVFPAGSRTRIVVRVNREMLWQGSIPARDEAQAGLWLGSAENEATVDFRSLSLFAP